jgi:lipopolysaccharide/colanic/teichoic acid biosynthesis glycosyltransferase
MQANSTINQSALSEAPNAFIGNDTAGWTHASEPLGDARMLATEGESVAWDYEFPELLAALDLPVPRRNAPYALRSESKRASYDLCKQLFDFVGSLILLLLALPLFLLTAICVKTTSRGPVLYKHKRLGRGGKEFWCLKFRTMVADADDQLQRNADLRQQFEEKYKIKHDPRVTRVGSFLRRTSLDELPQLIHVVRGEMSLIGPRPIVKPELSKYSIYGNKLLTVKPGLSGLWQAYGRSDTSYAERVLMDMHYIDHRSFGLDIELLLRTAVVVLKKSGAC